jgi:hypothetical protein
MLAPALIVKCHGEESSQFNLDGTFSCADPGQLTSAGRTESLRQRASNEIEITIRASVSPIHMP